MTTLQCAAAGPAGSGTAWFLTGDHAVLFDWNQPVHSAGSDFRGRATAGPFPVTAQWWPPLDVAPTPSASFDASISGDPSGVPAYAGAQYFFRGGRYARYSHAAAPPRTAENDADVSAWHLGPGFDRDVRGAWNGRKSRAGYAYFTRGQSYVRYSWADDEVGPDYPRPLSSLIDMPQEFWGGVDALLDGDGPFTDFGYLFAADRYARYDWSTLRVDNGPLPVHESWPGVLELLLAAQGKAIALEWVTDAANQLTAYASSLTTGIPSPFDTALVETALATHFHVGTGLDTVRRLDLMTRIGAQLTQIAATLTDLHAVIRFHDDAQVRADDAGYVDAAGLPRFRAYTDHQGHVTLTSRFWRMCDSAETAGAVLVHEIVHYLDAGSDCLHDSPEWYVAGTPRLTCPGGGEVPYYDQLGADDALHNPSSYNAFSQHVHFAVDRRIGVERPRP